jgi:hypothetical protein
MSNRRLKPTPKNLLEVTQAEITPYLSSGKQPNDNTVFSKNRATDISWKGDKQKDVSISLLDIDNAIYYYFNEVIKPTIVQDGQRVKVPVMFGTPERWKSVQADGYFRDANDKLTAPLIMFKRDSIEKNRTLGNKLDGNKAHLFQVFEERYNSRNAYDKFSIVTNRIPSKKMYATVIPDYVTVTYNCVIFTDYVEQNNKLIEAIEFASDSYWGDMNRFHFRTKIDSFATTTIIEVDQDRAAKTSFTFTVNGYIIPDSVNKELANMDGFYTKSQVIFDLETTTADLDRFTTAPAAKVSAMGATTFTADGGFGGGGGGTGGGASAADLAYLNTNKSAEATVVTANTATFGGQSLLQPAAGSTLPATSLDNFTFYAGITVIPKGVILSFAGSTNPVLTIDTTALGFDLTGTTITAIGKFQ